MLESMTRSVKDELRVDSGVAATHTQMGCIMTVCCDGIMAYGPMPSLNAQQDGTRSLGSR